MSLKKFKQTEIKKPQTKDKQLIQLIEKQKKMLKRVQDKMTELDYKIKKVSQSNQRNIARVQRHKARLHQLQKCKDRPQHLLAFSGIMNQYVQAFMITHNLQVDVDVSNINPDSMSYEQLLQLGQKIGKVSKGLTKQQIDTLEHISNIKKSQQCPICCQQYSSNQIGIRLRCKHIYHQQCIIQWLKDENRCPTCKQYVLKQHEQ